MVRIDGGMYGPRPNMGVSWCVYVKLIDVGLCAVL